MSLLSNHMRILYINALDQLCFFFFFLFEDPCVLIQPQKVHDCYVSCRLIRKLIKNAGFHSTEDSVLWLLVFKMSHHHHDTV